MYYNTMPPSESVHKVLLFQKSFLCKLHKAQFFIFCSFWKNCLKFFSCNLFLFDQHVGACVKFFHMLCNNTSCFLMASVNDTFHFLINDSCNAFTLRLGMTDISADENFITSACIVNQTNGIRHTVLCHHSTGCFCGSLDIL